MTNVHEGEPQSAGKDHARIVVQRMEEAQMLRFAVEANDSVLNNPNYVVGRQTPPGHWMDHQVALLREERLARTAPDTNQQQGEQ